MSGSNNMKRLAFFVGSDLTSWLICHDVLSHIQSIAEVEIFFPLHRVSKRIINEELLLLGTYERKVLQEVVFPILDIQAKKLGPYSAPSVFCKSINVRYQAVEDINDAAFFSYIREQFDGVVSLRCYQKFSASYVHYFREERILWNLHPGDLPSYRGVMTCFRAMQNREQQHAYTLHQMDADWDSGAIVAKSSVPLDLKRSFLCNMLALYPSGATVLIDNIVNYVRGKAPQYKSQGAGRYWHFPSQEEIQKSMREGVILADHEEIKKWYHRLFFSDADIQISQEFSLTFDSYVLGKSL